MRDKRRSDGGNSTKIGHIYTTHSYRESIEPKNQLVNFVETGELSLNTTSWDNLEFSPGIWSLNDRFSA